MTPPHHSYSNQRVRQQRRHHFFNTLILTVKNLACYSTGRYVHFLYWREGEEKELCDFPSNHVGNRVISLVGTFFSGRTGRSRFFVESSSSFLTGHCRTCRHWFWSPYLAKYLIGQKTCHANLLICVPHNLTVNNQPISGYCKCRCRILDMAPGFNIRSLLPYLYCMVHHVPDLLALTPQSDSICYRTIVHLFHIISNFRSVLSSFLLASRFTISIENVVLHSHHHASIP